MMALRAIATISWMLANLKLEFLSDLAAFYATLLAVAVPLAFSVTSQMSERYKSDVATREFAASKATKSLIVLLFLNVFFLVPARLFSNFVWLTTSALWMPIVSLLVLSMFIVILILFFQQMREILALFDARTFFDRLIARAQKSLEEKNINIAGSSLEGCADILLVELRRDKPTFVQSKLRDFTAGCASLAMLEEQEWQSDAMSRELTQEERFQLGFELQFLPHRLTPQLNVALSQLSRLFQGACEAHMPEIAADVAGALRRLLDRLMKAPENQTSVEQIMKTLLQLIDFAQAYHDDRVLGSLMNWYRFSVLQNDLLDPIYISSLNEHFSGQLQSFVRDGRLDDLKDTLALLVGGFNEYPNSDLVEICYMRHDIQTEELETLRKQINSFVFFTRIEEVAELIDSLKRLAEIQLDGLSEQVAEHWTSRVREAERRLWAAYKHQELLKLIFQLGAYCLSRKLVEFIPNIWYQNQPPDADANWVGADIIPQNGPELIGIFFGPVLSHQPGRFGMVTMVPLHTWSNILY